jgi:hypothetical protein
MSEKNRMMWIDVMSASSGSVAKKDHLLSWSLGLKPAWSFLKSASLISIPNGVVSGSTIGGGVYPSGTRSLYSDPALFEIYY